MKKTILALAASATLLYSCGSSDENTTTMNPFFEAYNTPFEVPPFDKIKNEHFAPALREGIKQHQAEIDAIVNNDDAPTFENTIEAMEYAGELLGKVSRVFGNLNSANTNDELQAIAKEMAPELSAHSDNISLNEKLFERVKAVWGSKEELDLNAEQQMLLEKTYKSFVRNGANLDEADKAKLREINSKLSSLTLQFGQNLLAETNAYMLVIENEADLAGLPQALIDGAADDAKAAGHEGKWVFTLQNPSIMPFLQYAENRELRKQIWEAYKNRADQGNEYDNKAGLIETANLRRQKAQLLGYNTHADYVLEESMAKNAENVYNLLNQLWTPALAKAKVERDEMQALVKAEGHDFSIEPWDWRYYEEKLRQQKFDLDEQEIKPYFSLPKVQEGVFMVVKNLWGLTFEEIQDIPVYHPDAKAYEVKEADGSHVGVIYMDFHPRASKRGGAWMTSYRSQKTENGERKAPVISIVCNFSRPTANAPALLTFDEVTTFFHEFGHALHGLLSNVQYQSLAGTSVPRDFVELPSQIMENWATEPSVMKQYAFHYETGEVIPDDLIAKLTNSGTFGQGFGTTEYLAASLMDLDYHTQAQDISMDATAFEKASMAKIGLIDEIIPRYRSPYFQHIFAGGYSSGYYSYIWSGVLDTDAFQAFKETDLFNQEKAKAFRKEILERGGTDEPMNMYVNFRGAEPKIDALLKKRGLDQVAVERTK
ncbi:peptidyl-dipeptidase Dcp Metallo peptidase. MEROPS family M03A [Belliella buryatensis]|uniref:Peptidyl-dipeptidase Dcp Metallo peptidase. MEROPS family M03A n=1 Tax=Belliella buryatensis TaxID=1500549 RepID=A0A239DVH0_9BACT|nr:M3 family metallopeptidase [Belliella buryatensis]SNS36239.1 peptidyl-dipeptidase Dcp Metallo peptidase. MEROPS family M03A [Belliella buryatensis]